jgi:hypothetical protein
MNTPLDVLVDALNNAASWNPAAEIAPEAVLWCDPAREFNGLIRTFCSITWSAAEAEESRAARRNADSSANIIVLD